jgi:hypothetical protein
MRPAKIDRVTLEPGDSTRYDLDIIRHGDDELIVVLYRTRQRSTGWSMTFSPAATGCIYRPHEVANKMGCDVASAAIVLAYLRAEFGLCIDLAQGFKQDTGVWVGATLH